MPHHNGNNDSKEQRNQAARNAARKPAASESGIDKKLNGPNRPST